MSADPKDVDFDVLDLLEKRKRDRTIEECARVAQDFSIKANDDADYIARAIRALKDKP